MNDHDDRDLSPDEETWGREDAEGRDAEAPSHRNRSDDARRAIVRRLETESAAPAPVVLPPNYWDEEPSPPPKPGWAEALRRRAGALAAVALAVTALGAAAYVVVDHQRQAGLLAARAAENAKLAQTLSALNARLQAIETVKGRDEVAELRRSFAEVKTATAASRELSAAIAQLSQRVEKLDREQGLKLDKLGERVDRQASARAADLAARLDRLEKTSAAPPPAPAPQPPKFGPNVAMDPTGSIDRSRQVLRGYVVLGAQNGAALIGGRMGERAVRVGDAVPGAGRVQRVEQQGANWVVVTDQGLIPSAYAAPD